MSNEVRSYGYLASYFAGPFLLAAICSCIIGKVNSLFYSLSCIDMMGDADLCTQFT